MQTGADSTFPAAGNRARTRSGVLRLRFSSASAFVSGDLLDVDEALVEGLRQAQVGRRRGCDGGVRRRHAQGMHGQVALGVAVGDRLEACEGAADQVHGLRCSVAARGSGTQARTQTLHGRWMPPGGLRAGDLQHPVTGSPARTGPERRGIADAHVRSPARPSVQ